MAVSKEDEIGALWTRQGGRGEFLSGTLTRADGSKLEIVVFKNDHKQPGERTPDWRIYKSQPRDQQPAPQPTRPAPKVDDLDSDIPF